MRRFIGLLLLVAMIGLTHVLAQELESQTSDSAGINQIDVSKEVKEGTRGFVYTVIAEIPSERFSGLSFHVSSSKDDQWRLAEQGEGELQYGYFEYQGRQSYINTRLGRQQLTYSTLYNRLDGINISSYINKSFAATFYAGSPAYDANEIAVEERATIGGYLLFAQDKRQLTIAYQKINAKDDNQEATALGFRMPLPLNLKFSGHTNFTKGVTLERTHSYRLDFGSALLKPLSAMFQIENLAPVLALTSGKDDIDSYLGTIVSLQPREKVSLELIARGYELFAGEDDARRYYYSTQVSFKSGSANDVGAETGAMVSTIGSEQYVLLRVFYNQQKLDDVPVIDFINTDITYKDYTQPSSNDDKAVSLSFGCGKRLLGNALLVKLSGNYSQVPDADNILEGGIRFDYHFQN